MSIARRSTTSTARTPGALMRAVCVCRMTQLPTIGLYAPVTFGICSQDILLRWERM